MLTVIGYGGLLIGSQVYSVYYRDTEYRKLIMIDALITILTAPMNFIYVCRWNLAWGISDMYFVIFTDVVSEIVTQCFVFLPMSVIMAKITPKHIEATSFALLAGVSNLRIPIRAEIGSFINDNYVGVTQEDLSNYYKLVAINFIGSFIPLLFLRLIPTKAQVEALQNSNKEDENKKVEIGSPDQGFGVEMGKIGQ